MQGKCAGCPDVDPPTFTSGPWLAGAVIVVALTAVAVLVYLFGRADAQRP